MLLLYRALRKTQSRRVTRYLIRNKQQNRDRFTHKYIVNATDIAGEASGIRSSRSSCQLQTMMKTNSNVRKNDEIKRCQFAQVFK